MSFFAYLESLLSLPQTLPAPRFDFFALFIMLGIGQGFFLAFFFLTGERRKVLSNRLLGLALLTLALAMSEVLLCYTNYMFEVLFLIDFSEPLNFFVAPIFYLYLYTKIYNRFEKKQYWHFLPFLLYLIYSLSWQLQPIAYKYNAYISAYHLELLPLPVSYWLPYDPFLWKEYVNECMVVSLCFYFVLSVRLLRQTFQSLALPFWSKENEMLTWLRKIILHLLLILFVFILIKIFYKEDLGDHILAVHLAFVIYLISFQVIQSSVFFQPPRPEVKKYERSSLTEELQKQSLARLEKILTQEKPFLQSDFSQPILAKQIGISTHHLSQIINENFNQNFFEFTATYRIREAQTLLADPTLQHLKIEEIAEQVGYLSKSSFHTAFKKQVGMTPSEYKKSLKNNK
ncbi:helix-turn-helix domain-containing protein [Hugenholtzia roseola]|uniref:helix-turn-helix domain-containing protein n=1 Tax=Hugenholtzia roseola TaxID=1002 RepID=UPI0012B5B94F|nr:AraC family transcriptional regulator [Hugenholtzia roseola]